MSRNKTNSCISEEEVFVCLHLTPNINTLDESSLNLLMLIL